MKQLLIVVLTLVSFSSFAETRTFEDGPHIGVYFGNIEAKSKVIAKINESVKEFSLNKLNDEMGYTFSCSKAWDIMDIVCAVEANSPSGSILATLVFEREASSFEVTFLKIGN